MLISTFSSTRVMVLEVEPSVTVISVTVKPLDGVKVTVLVEPATIEELVTSAVQLPSVRMLKSYREAASLVRATRYRSRITLSAATVTEPLALAVTCRS